MDVLPTRPAHKIVLLLHDFYAGGAERIAVTLANAWHAAGRDVTLLCGSDAGPFRTRVAPGVGIVVVQPPIPQGRGSRIRLGFACARVLRRLPADVVFAPGNFHLPVIGIAARAAYARRPVFACKLSNRLYRPDRAHWRQAVFNLSARLWTARLDGVVAMSPRLRDAARTLLRGRAVECIWEPCIADDTLLAAPRVRAATVPRILVVGRLVAEKDVSLALRAFAAFVQVHAATLQVVGDGPERARLEREARALGIADRVTFTGHVADTRPCFGAADVLLSTSRYEGYPAVIIEALAAGVPVVATDSSPALAEMLFDATFGAIAPSAPRALADALGQALLRRPAAVPLAQLIARHRATPVARAYLDWFDRLCRGRPG